MKRLFASRRRLLAVAGASRVRLGLAVFVVVLAASAGSAGADNPVLTGDVGLNDEFVISLVDASGKKVTHVDAGSYTLLVHDRSAHHNFHLYGPGVDVMTDFNEVGDRTFTVTLVDGTYVFVCDPHPSRMKGTFTVGSVTAPPPAGNLNASISGASKSTLGPLSEVSAGRYVISVRDRSKKDGFRLSGPGVTRSTTARFTGLVKWTVTLRGGTYSYGSARFPKLRGSFTVPE
jgi:hypothetical protein